MLSKVAALALVASAAAQNLLTITSPGPNIWWVDESLNTLAWTPCDTATQALLQSFNVVLMNQNQQVLTGNLSILGAQPVFDCSKSITPQNVPVGTGYTMFLTNSTNTNQVVGSTTFEMKAKGSTYPPPVTTSSSPSATSNSSASTSSPTSSSNTANDLVFNLQGLFSAVVGAGAFIGFF